MQQLIIDYTATVEEINEESLTMVVRFKAPGCSEHVVSLYMPPEDMDPALHIRSFAPLHIWKEEMTTRKLVKVGDVLMDTVKFGIQNIPDVADDPQVFMPTIVLEPST
jgi:hypothetical protein